VPESLTFGSVTFRAVTFSVGAAGNPSVPNGDWTSLLPGPDIAISVGVTGGLNEDADTVFATPVFAAGFDFVEPENGFTGGVPFLTRRLRSPSRTAAM
jgi:hypothetical protein